MLTINQCRFKTETQTPLKRKAGQKKNMFLRVLWLSSLVGAFRSTVIPQAQHVTTHYWTTLHSGEAAKGPEVLCVGDALFDCIANNEAKGLSMSRVVEAGAWTAFPGGAPANVASALVKLGTRAAFAGCVGADGDGDALQSLLEDIGVDISLMQRSETAPTRRVMVERSVDGDRSFAGFWQGAPYAGSFWCCFSVR
jgi:hypothetical protein